MKFFVNVLKEPLLHFLVLGSALFALAYFWGDSSAGPEDGEIVVSEGKVRSLAHIFQRTWQRPPTQQELDGLIEDYVNEEVFYREALGMGLDRDDTIIRRRLRQKLEFVAEDMADAVEPTDEELTQYLEANPDQYRLEDRTTFIQVYFSPQKRGEALVKDVEQALAALRSDDEVDPIELGDATLLPFYHDDLRDTEVAGLLGRDFVPGLKEAEVGTWSDPIESSYGLHLIYVQQRTPGHLPNLGEVRDAVRRDWFAERRAESKRQFYDSLRERYEVVIEMPVADESAGDGVEAEGESAGAESS